MVRTAKSLFVAIALGSLFAGTAVAEEKLAIYPADVNLTSANDFQSFVLQRTLPDGVTLDVTSNAKLSIADPKIAKLEGNIVRPLADGTTELVATEGGATLKIPVYVKGAQAAQPISFKLDVVPALTKAGCNSGSCHGASRGKDGFRLSLFGFDPDGDYDRITRELPGRRLNLAVCEDSLLLQKAAGQVDHTGGDLMDPDGKLYQSVLKWVEMGAPKDSDKVAKPVSIEIMPSRVVLGGPNATQQLVVRAHYSDGTDRDITDLAILMSNNDNSVSVDETGKATSKQRGEAFVLARFDAFAVTNQVLVVPTQPFQPKKESGGNYIDDLITTKLNKLRIEPSEICTDEEFLRRVSIDIVGQMPTPEEYAKFLADKRPDKRKHFVDELLSRKEFAEIWVMNFAEVLQIRSSNQVSPKATLLFFNWLGERIAAGDPLDETFYDLLTSTGGTFRSPGANFYQNERDKLKIAENVAQVFLGMRIQCAQCHNHPFDRWTMDDYYSFASFFSQIGRKPGEDRQENIIFNSGGGEVKHPVGGRVMKPKFLGGETANTAGRDRREVVAEWITSKENPYFATNLANRIWAHYFGRGIVEPVDDVRISNPPSNPELLDALAGKLIEYDYDLKKFVRDICTSNAYQRSSKPNDSNRLDESNFARGNVRRVKAEILLDCISQVTDTEDDFSRLPKGARAITIPDGRTSTYFLTTFGRAKRETVCACESLTDPTLSQALHMLNGDTTNSKIQQGKLVEKMLKEGKKPEEIIESLYVRCLSRKPTEEERKRLGTALAEAKDDAQKRVVLEDIFWALLNSKEFVFNH
ncbi:hypothetical protein Pan216_50310 [Planctomycetes bacterium Pan216]|uniref:Bacterial Ig-like domain (Group 2) n=1 Tax=Kolteria novifilia TaxID=2527975 RepID=A0A518BAY7_9BACT|nr:hypothetical protein Pan216_50310 [Planctomycetes bacterium Pan216]